LPHGSTKAGLQELGEHAGFFDSLGNDPSSGLLNECEGGRHGGHRRRVVAETGDNVPINFDDVESDEPEGMQACVGLARVIQHGSTRTAR
jgi:hypothetical protein